MRFQIFMFLFLSSFSVFAQHTLQGTVKDEKGQALMFANVQLLTAAGDFIKGEVADVNGYFNMTNLASGSYVLGISAIGYQDFRREIQLAEDLILEGLVVEQSSVALDEITVTAQKVAYVRKADRTVVNVGSLPTAAGGNALELLEKSPSVRIDRVSSDVSLLGRNNVVVFINGKRLRLDGNEMLQYLATIPAANIVHFELINNPPASYDADGTGGVINIVLKDFEADGFNGHVNLYSGYGQYGKYGGGLLFNYKSGRVNIYGDAATSQDYTVQDSDIASAIQFDAGLLETVQRSSRPAYLGNYNAKLGVSYAFDDRTAIDVFGSFARRRWTLEASTTTEYISAFSSIQNDLLAGDETNTTNQYNISTHLQRQLKNGHTLSADYDYLNFDIRNPTSYQLSNFDANDQLLDQSSFETKKETPFNFHVGKLDYKGAFSDELQFETGIKAIFSEVENNTDLLSENREPNTESQFTDALDLTEQIYAAYFSLAGSFGNGYTFTGGLRYEYSNLELTSNQGDLDRQISRLFPTLSLTRTFSEVSRLTLAYRERIARPGFQNLAPAFFFLNPYTVLAGNIQAQPNINRTAELTLNHGSLFASLSYSKDDSPIIRYAVPRLNQADNLLLLISDNIEGRHQIGLDVGFPMTYTKFWNARYSIGGYWRRDELNFADVRIVESNPVLSIDISQNFQLPSSWSIELSGRWNSRTYQGAIYQPQQTFVNLGVQKKFKNSTLGLSWTDIFNSGSFLGFVNQLPEQGIVYDWNYDLEGSIIRLSYSYNFGGKQVKKARDSGASDVLRRVNN